VNETTEGFRGDYHFLSNFALAPVAVLGRTWPSSEHAFQAHKSMFARDKAAVPAWLDQLQAASIRESKTLGKRLAIDLDAWNDFSAEAMRRTLAAKFSDPGLAYRLKSTGDTVLIEYNQWGDRIWGVDAKTGEGANRLGGLLMELRATLQEN
jgi:ribA/ribD-fused uncharacterized protein